MAAPSPASSRPTLGPGPRFAVSFLAWLLASSFLFWLLDLHLRLVFLQRGLATLGAWFDRLLGGEAHVKGTEIVLEALTLDINHECTGVFLLMVFTSFLLAYPAPASRKLWGIVVGLPALEWVNAIRLGVLGRLVEIYPAAFFYFHEYVWQGVFMALVLLGCMSWAERVERS